MSEKIEVGETSEFEDGVMREVLAQGHEIIVLRLGDVYYAADARCPHRKGRLSQGTLEGTVVTCPLHGSRFDLQDGRVVRWLGMTGIVLKATGLLKVSKSLKTYKVGIEGDKVLVEVRLSAD